MPQGRRANLVNTRATEAPKSATHRHKQLPVGANADDRIARRDVTNRTTELATIHKSGSRPADLPADDRIRPVGVVGAWESRECLTTIAITSSLGTASPLLVLSDRTRLRRSGALEPPR